MKRHIAEFLGELAEELGWEPEFEGQRVVPERTATGPVALHDMPSSNELRLQRLDEEVRHLRSNVDHLGAETTQLRAEMARLKKLPAPPDARSGAPTAAGTGGDVRQWPAHLLPKPADKPAPPVMAAPVAEAPVMAAPVIEAPVIEAPTVESAKKDTAPAEPARDPKPDPEPDPEPDSDPDQERDGGKSEAEEKRIEPPVTQPVLATPVATEVDNESPLELFPSEPRTATNAGASTPVS